MILLLYYRHEVDSTHVYQTLNFCLYSDATKTAVFSPSVRREVKGVSEFLLLLLLLWQHYNIVRLITVSTICIVYMYQSISSTVTKVLSHRAKSFSKWKRNKKQFLGHLLKQLGPGRFFWQIKIPKGLASSQRVKLGVGVFDLPELWSLNATIRLKM